MPLFFLKSSAKELVGKGFVLVMVDPDSPTPQDTALAQIRHLVISLDQDPRGEIAHGVALFNSTPAASDYLAPGPPAGSAPHR